jgi:hypothetical protein
MEMLDANRDSVRAVQDVGGHQRAVLGKGYRRVASVAVETLGRNLRPQVRATTLRTGASFA